MERLTDKDLTKACNDPWDYCGLDAVCARNCHKPTPCKLPKMIYRLAEIEDILGDDYDLDRLRELAQADREGRCVVLRSEDTNVLTRADRIRTMSDEELTGQFGAQSNEPLTQTDLNKMYLNEVWLEYPDGSGETALVVWGKLYSTSVLEGAGLDLEEYIMGETLDAPTGTYKVYRRPPEGEEEKT